MPGSNNNVQYGNGYRLESSAAQEWQLMQATATDVSCVNNAGSPEGVVPANMGSICHDRTNGNLYVKHTGTGNTGWVLVSTGGASAISSFGMQTGTSPVVPTGAGLVTFNGAVVAAGTNPIRTNGTGANTMALQVQIAQAIAATDATKIGLSNFNSTYFSVDANGFVTPTAALSTDLHTARYIVSAGGTADGANYTTIATAYAAAVAAGAPQTVFIQPGTYTENLTLTPGINISAYSCDAYTPNVIIKGKLTLTTAGTVSISGCELLTNADFAISCTGANQCKIIIINCKLFANDANAIQFTNSNGNSKIEIYSSLGDIASTNAYFTHSGAGKIAFYNSVLGNNAASTTASTLSGSGSVDINTCYFANAITTSSTSVFTMGNTSFHGALIVGGTGAGQSISLSYLDGGTASSVSIGVGATLPISNSSINSSNANAITGAGTLQYGGLTFTGSSSTVNTTTQTVLNEGPSRTIGTATSGATNTLTVTNSSNTATSKALIVSTVGGGTADDAYYQAVVAGTTTWSWGVDNSDSDAWVLAASATLGTTNVMRVQTTGEINYPLQTAFLARLATQDTNVTGDGTTYTLGGGNALTVVFDQNSDFNTNGTFTAPVTGRYQLSAKLGVTGMTTGMTVGTLTIVTSNRNYTQQIDPAKVFDANTTATYSLSVLVDMDAADTSTVTLQISNGTKAASVQAAATNATSMFSGYLAC